MKILHLLDHSLPIHSGYSFRSAEILKAQAKMGYEVMARTGPKHYGAPGKDALDTGIQYRRSPYSSRILASVPIVDQLEVIRILRRDICQIDTNRQIDVLHAHSPSLNGIAAILTARSNDIPVVYEMRASWEDAAVDHGTSRRNGFRYHATRASETWVLQHADAITTICEGLKEDICARGIVESKVTVVPNAVDADRFRPLTESRVELRRKIEADDKFVVVFCGSFYSYEGLDLLIDTLSTFVVTFPRTLVLLAGGGEQEEKLKQQVRLLQLDEHVKFLGRVTQDVVIELYNLSDVCVFPRRRMRLTDMVTPLKPLEAMATGAVVLASDVGGHRELISDGSTGFLFKAGDPDALFGALSHVCAHGDWETIRSSARRYVSTQRNWAESAAKYEDVYRRVISCKD